MKIKEILQVNLFYL